ncbi:MAG: hypothetical protein LBI81_01340 [Puniceicoccales bacterium]|jgi:hypothetical protein|nr:hypothetical protein [Puniceicoccales bacterium]
MEVSIVCDQNAKDKLVGFFSENGTTAVQASVRVVSTLSVTRANHDEFVLELTNPIQAKSLGHRVVSIFKEYPIAASVIGACVASVAVALIVTGHGDIILSPLKSILGSAAVANK